MVRGWLRETTGGLPRTFWYLWCGTLVNRLGGFVLIFLTVYLTKERGFSDIQAGLVVGLWSAGGGIGTMVGGILADRWGRRPTLLIAHVGGASMMLLLGFSRPFAMIAGVAFALGTFAEAARPAFAAMMVDVVPDRDRVRAFSLNYWAINLGFASAAILGGFAAHLDYLLLFVLDASATLVTAAIVFVKIKETRPTGAHVPSGAGSGRGGLGMVLRDRVFLIFTGANLLGAMVFLQHVSMLPIAMSDDGLSSSTFGWVIALNGLLIVLGQLFIPKLIAGHGRARVLAVGTIVQGVGFGLTALAGSAWLYAMTVLIWTVGEMVYSPANAATIADLAPASVRGRYQGVFALSWSIAGFTAPVAGGFVRDLLGNSALWIGCALIAFVAAAINLSAGPARERRAAVIAAAARVPSPRAAVAPAPPGVISDTLAPTSSAS
ncbi:Predicted arabinose efflux permease, MFS family [Asanoa hainanensis]|uniref:Predicted arabinose efflux permease, MFS family n=1 Tax=Asanoa hainanensis TaxID=560556 RepID=A0A239P3M2_9ACTN|nr:Predicted arabinose efflux permease, MFS family [Asanoa hainanensis]